MSTTCRRNSSAPRSILHNSPSNCDTTNWVAKCFDISGVVVVVVVVDITASISTHFMPRAAIELYSITVFPGTQIIFIRSFWGSRRWRLPVRSHSAVPASLNQPYSPSHTSFINFYRFSVYFFSTLIDGNRKYIRAVRSPQEHRYIYGKTFANVKYLTLFPTRKRR